MVCIALLTATEAAAVISTAFDISKSGFSITERYIPCLSGE